MTDYAPVTTTCPACAVGCSLAYDADAGRATGREGPVNRNGRLCPEGIGAFDGLDGDDRLTTPLVREDGELREATWGEAYGRIASAFGDAIDRGGPDALAFLGAPRSTTEANYLLGKVARLLGTNNVDNRARICHAATTRALSERLGVGASTNGLADLAEAEAILAVGSNPAARQPIAFNSYVRPAVNGGATLIHVDPHGTETTRLADHHLAARPGSDAALLRALSAVILERGDHDEGFVAARTTGFEAFARRLADLDVDATAAESGVDPGDLRAAARAFGSAERGAAITGTGIEPEGHAETDAPDALLDLLLLTGNLGRDGTGFHVFRGLTNEQGAVDAGCRPFALPGGVPVDDAVGRDRVAAEWGVEPPAEPGRDELSLVGSFGDEVRCAWVIGENPAVTTLDADAVARGLDALDCLVVQELFPTETTAHADVVLPAGAAAESDGTVVNLDRQVQRVRAAAAPPGDARRDWRIVADLGARLTDRGFDYDGPAEVFAELSRVAPPYAGMTYDAVSDGGCRWPFPEGADAGVRVLHRERFANGERRVPFSGSA